MLDEVEALDSDDAESNNGGKAANDDMDDFDAWIAETEDVVGGSADVPEKDATMLVPTLEQPLKSTGIEMSVARSLLRKRAVEEGPKEDYVEQATTSAYPDDFEADDTIAEQEEVEVDVDVDGSDSRFDTGADQTEEKEVVGTEDADILELEDEGDEAPAGGSGEDQVSAEATAAAAVAAAEAEAEEPDCNAALAAPLDDFVDEDVWDVDELTAQSELLGEIEARTREGLKEAPASKAKPAPVPKPVPKASLNMPEDPPASPPSDMDLQGEQAAEVEVMEINTDDEDPVLPNEEAADGEPSPDEPDDILGAVSSLLDDVRDRVEAHKKTDGDRVASSGLKKRASTESAGGPPATKQKTTARLDPPEEMEGDGLTLEAEDDGEEVDVGSCDMKLLVVNLVDVGEAYAKTVLEESDAAAFDWEGVRTCLQYLRYERGFQMVGVAPQGFKGADSWSGSECTLPEDVRTLCESMEEPSCKASHCSSHTLALAKSKHCRFVDSKAKPRRAVEALRLPYVFDAAIGTFTALDAASGD